MADEALAFAELSGDESDLLRARFAKYVAYFDGPDIFSDQIIRERAAVREAIAAFPSKGPDAPIVRMMIWAGITHWLITGTRSMPDIKARLAQVISEMDGTRIPAAMTSVRLVFMMGQVMEGRFTEAQDFAQRLFERFDNAVLFNGAWPGQYLYIVHREQATLEGYVDEISRFAREDRDWGRYWQIRLILALVESGKQQDATRLFDELVRDDFVNIVHDWSWLENIATLGEIAHLLGDRERAATIVSLLEPYAHLNAGVWFGADFIGAVAYYLGLLATTLERWDEADKHFRFALERHEFIQLPPYIANTQHQYAAMLVKRGNVANTDRARELNERALSAAREMGMVRLERLATALAKEIELRIEGDDPDGVPYDLTPREVDVLRSLTLGSTDREIADELSISHRTVQVHVSNILGKLGVGSRTAAAALAIREQLL